MPKKYSEEERRNFCEKWKSSGQNKINFCKEHKISESALHKWLMRFEQVLPIQPLSSSSPPGNEKRINFLSIEGISKATKHHEVEILLPSGILLKAEVASVALLVRELVA